jgi:hypothetical protein
MTPLGRLHALLRARGLADLPAVLRSMPDLRLVGGFLLLAILGDNPRDAQWASTDVDVEVPFSCLPPLMHSLARALAAAGATMVVANVVRSAMDAHATLTYRFRFAPYAIDVLERPKRAKPLVMDMSCLDNHYDGRVLHVRSPTHVFALLRECKWRPQSSKIVARSWQRVLKYRARGFRILPEVHDKHQFATQLRDYEHRAHTLEVLSSYDNHFIDDQGPLPFHAGCSTVQARTPD